ncbi:MAG TPA: Gldg family protein, partial [Rhizomicrobium sp.]|nr:Gldg family protein [Rhizomicrobium sp.]
LALATILFVGLNVFVDYFFTDARIDLTENRQYTLSQGTRNIVAALPEPVTLRFYFSKKNSANYPVTAAYAKRVRDLLSEYATISNGKILLEDVDPEAFTPEQDQAEAAGIRSAPVNNGDVFYFGLEGTNSIDGKSVLPYLAIEREPYLEYDITSLLYQLSHPDKPKIAILGNLPLTNNPMNQGQPLAIYSELRRNYDIATVQPNFRDVPAGTNLLMVVHPGTLSLNQQRAIASYMMKGGKALIFVDPLSEIEKSQAENGDRSAQQSSDMPDLLKGMGVNYIPDLVVLDRKLAQHIRAGDQQQTVVYPLWSHLRPESFAPRDPVTASLTAVNVASTGALSQAKGATTKFEPLLTSSDQASLSGKDNVVAAMNDPASLLDQTDPAKSKSYVIAARVTGHVKVNGLGEGDVNMIVVADTDIFDDRFWVRLGDDQQQPFADNGAFVLGAVENMTGSGDLISLRTRGNTERPFTVVREMQNAAELKFSETLTVLQSKLAASQNEMSQLQQGRGAAAGSNTALTAAQNAQIERVRRDIAGTRIQLRQVQNSLRTDIDRLGTELVFLNILLMPVLVAVFAISFGLMRRRRAQAAPRVKVRTVEAGAA